MKKLMMFVAGAYVLFAARAAEVYVSPTGTEGASGDSEHPIKSINAAIAMLGAEGGTIYLADGTYQDEVPTGGSGEIANSAIALKNAITIEGLSKDPSKVTVQRSDANGKFRIFYLNHESAALRHLTVALGELGADWLYGGGVYIDSKGGTVENCIIRDCKNGGNGQCGGAGVYMKAGRVSRSVVRDCTAKNMRNYGTGIYAEGGVIDNSLVTGCKSCHHIRANGNGAVCLMGSAKMVNCTVVKNTSCLVSGVIVGSANARVVNCAVYGNGLCTQSHDSAWSLRYSGCFATADVGVTAEQPTEKSSYTSAFANCATERFLVGSAGCVSLSASPFSDFDKSDYTIADSTSPLANAGDSVQARAEQISSTDLAGNGRYSGVRIDIGAYELQEGFTVSAVADKYELKIPEDNPVTFTAEISGTSEAVAYHWDFGDEETLETTNPTVEHSYAQPGHYTVCVTATTGSESSSYTLPEKIVVRRFSCEFSMMTTNVVLGAEAVFAVEKVVETSPLRFTWDFGDGTPKLETSEHLVRHVYANSGKYLVSVVVDGGDDGQLAYAFDRTVDVIQKDIFVNQSGSGTFPFDTADKGATTIAAALADAAEGCVIHLVAATYNLKNVSTDIRRGVRIVGEGNTPEETVLMGYGSNNGKRNLRVEHEGARVENLTLDGGYAGSETGGNLYLGAGVVSNCVLRNGRSNSGGGGAGGVFIKGGLLTHCVITNSYLGNRGNGIAVMQTGGRVSNCLIGYNKREWLSSRNAFSVVYATGGVMDNCTIAGLSLLKYSADMPLQMNTTSDTGVNIGSNARVYNLTISDARYYVCKKFTYDTGTVITPEMVDLCDDAPKRWAGTAASFVNCATDDATPINDTCFVGTLEKGSLFVDYENKDLTPGAVTKNKGTASDDFAFPSVDLAGNPRVVGKAIDIGCYERQPAKGSSIIIR